MQNSQVAPEQVYNYSVIDSQGNHVGAIDGVWIDDATNALEFVAVKTGWLFGKNHVIPAANAQFDNENQSATVPYSTDQIKNAPSFASDAELSPQDEEQIYSHYGLDRSTAPSPTGLPDGDVGQATGERTTDSAGYGSDQTGYAETGTTGTGAAVTSEGQDIALAAEELQVGKREVEAGRVRIRKVVRTEHQEVPVDLRREEIQIERVDTDDVPLDASSSNAFQEQTVEVPLMREEAVVAKEGRVVEHVRVGKSVETQTETVGGETRREDVEIDRGVNETSTTDRPRTDRTL